MAVLALQRVPLVYVSTHRNLIQYVKFPHHMCLNTMDKILNTHTKYTMELSYLCVSIKVPLRQNHTSDMSWVFYSLLWFL